MAPRFGRKVRIPAPPGGWRDDGGKQSVPGGVRPVAGELGHDGSAGSAGTGSGPRPASKGSWIVSVCRFLSSSYARRALLCAWSPGVRRRD